VIAMKKLMLILAFGALGSAASAQDEFTMDIFFPPKVPAEVQAKFEQLYPGADDVAWEVENGNYEAEFEVNDLEYEVRMDPLGNVLYTEEEISPSELPSAITSYIESNYEGKKVREASRLIDGQGNITYEAEVKRDDLLFDENGNFLGEET
jgi:hypothetical protein